MQSKRLASISILLCGLSALALAIGNQNWKQKSLKKHSDTGISKANIDGKSFAFEKCTYHIENGVFITQAISGKPYASGHSLVLRLDSAIVAASIHSNNRKTNSDIRIALADTGLAPSAEWLELARAGDYSVLRWRSSTSGSCRLNPSHETGVLEGECHFISKDRETGKGAVIRSWRFTAIPENHS